MDTSASSSFGGLPTPPCDPPVPPHPVGASVVQRSVRRFPETGPAVGFAVGGTVLHDAEDLVVMLTVPGSGMAGRGGPRSGPNGRLVAPGDWDGSYELSTWRGDAVVRVHRPGEPWSIWRWHDGTDWTRRWYGNLEAPWRRTPIGYDMQDWALACSSGARGSPPRTGAPGSRRPAPRRCRCRRAGRSSDRTP